MTQPDYKRIFTDILNTEHPDKICHCKKKLEKEQLSSIDIVLLNKIVFGNNGQVINALNQKHRTYDRSAILEILTYKKIHKCNNSQLARQFNLRRNTVAKWKKIFIIKQ